MVLFIPEIIFKSSGSWTGSPEHFGQTNKVPTSEYRNIYCVTYHSHIWMSAGDPLLRVALRASNTGPKNGLDQTLGVPHERKLKLSGTSHRIQNVLYQTYFSLHKYRQTPKKGSQFFCWIKHRRYHMKSI